MAEYLVTWAIEVDAASPEEAAQVALLVQRDPASVALVFNVVPYCTDCKEYHSAGSKSVDLAIKESRHVH